MERRTFLRTLPFLRPITLDDTTNTLPIWNQHRKIILEEISRSKPTENGDVDDESTTATSSTSRMTESIGTIISKDHVVSIEPTDIHTGQQSNSPAFFISKKMENKSVSNRDGNETENLIDDPSLCPFQAFLLPANLPQLVDTRRPTMGFTTPSNRNTKSKTPVTAPSTNRPWSYQKNHSPAVSSVSTSLSKSQSPKMTTPHQLVHHNGLIQNKNDFEGMKESLNESYETAVLYLLFEGKYLFCADHTYIRSITVFPGEALTTNSASNNQASQVVISKPPCMVLLFDMCAFRIFDGSFLLPSPSTSLTASPEEQYPRRKLKAEEDRLQSVLIQLQNFIQQDRQLYWDDEGINRMNIFSRPQFGGRLQSMTSPASLLRVIHTLQERQSDGISHENAQNNDAVGYPTETMEKLLIEGSTSSSISTDVDKKAQGGGACTTSGREYDSSLKMNESSRFLNKNINNVSEQDDNKYKEITLDQKQNAYAISWAAVQKMKRIMPRTKGRDNETMSDQMSKLAALCAEKLEYSYCDSLIECLSYENDDMNKDEERMKLQKKLSNVRKELDSTMEKIFPAAPKSRPMKVGRRNMEHRMVAVQPSTNNLDDMIDLQKNVERYLENHKDMVFKKHMMTFLPSR